MQWQLFKGMYISAVQEVENQSAEILNMAIRAPQKSLTWPCLLAALGAYKMRQLLRHWWSRAAVVCYRCPRPPGDGN